MSQSEELAHIFEELRTAISQTAGNDPAEIYPEADLEDDLGLSTLDLARITNKLNHKLNIEIDVDDVADLETVEEWLQLVIDEVRLG